MAFNNITNIKNMQLKEKDKISTILLIVSIFIKGLNAKLFLNIVYLKNVTLIDLLAINNHMLNEQVNNILKIGIKLYYLTMF